MVTAVDRRGEDECQIRYNGKVPAEKEISLKVIFCPVNLQKMRAGKWRWC